MKVGIIYYQYPLYYQGSYIQEQVDSIAHQTDKVVLIATHFPADASFKKPSNLTVLWVKRNKIPLISDLIFNVAVFYAAITSKEFRQIDVLNVVCSRGIIAAKAIQKILRKPLVCTIEIISQNDGSTKEWLISTAQRMLYTMGFDKIICWSKYYKKILVSWKIPRKKITLIPGGINTKRYCPEIDGSQIRKKFPAKCLLIVFAKPMYEYNRKMAEFLLEVMVMLKKKIDVRLLLGSGEQREIIETKIKKLNLENKVSFMPVVPITKIPQYIAASDIIVLPYTYQATVSRSLLESLAMGKPVITTKSGEVANLVTHKENAYLVDLDKKEVAKAVIKLYRNKQLAQKLSNNARKLIIENFSDDQIAKKIIKEYKKVIYAKRQ